MDDIRLKTLSEATYLTTDNAWRYRAILYYFYVEHEKMRQYLFPEDIFSHLKESPHFQIVQSYEEQEQDRENKRGDLKNAMERCAGYE